MVTADFYECLAGKAFQRDTCEILCFVNLSYLIYAISTHTIYTSITHICWGVLQRENPSHNLWELERVIPTFLYTIHCGFSSTPTSPFLYPWEVDSPNTYHTHPECKVRFWCCWEALEEAICLVNAIQLNCMIRKAREDKAWRIQLVAGAWKAQVHGVN